MTNAVSSRTLEEMVSYYGARAHEYDDWWYRRGRYDRNAEDTARWHTEVKELYAVFDSLSLGGDVLELAPGTGTWTQRLVRTARSVTAVDASPAMRELNRAHVRDERVTYVIADLFAWAPERVYDAVCFGFWLSHVPVERLDDFLETIAKALRPGGDLFFADSLTESTALHDNRRVPGAGSQVMARTLADGREYQIVKNYHDSSALSARFARAGLDVPVRQTATYFQYGTGVHTRHVK